MNSNGKSESITRSVLSDEISAALPDLSHRDASRVVDSILRGIRDSLAKGEEVKISGFGKWILQDKNARKGRNPQTGAPLTISARRVLKFKPSEVLREELNENPFETQKD
jgi:integration host factor subunit alpha